MVFYNLNTEKSLLNFITFFKKIIASLAIAVWVLLVSTGILVARYFKTLLEDKKPMGVNVWFFIHRPVMVLAAVLSIASFILILV